MARLVGVDLPREKRMEIALTYIYGIGRTRSKETLAATGVDPNMRSADLTVPATTRLSCESTRSLLPGLSRYWPSL